MTSTINVPPTLGDAQAHLDQLYGVLNAAGWERAAIVYAYVQRGQGRHNLSADNKLSVKDFAGLGIMGLRNTTTVVHYLDAWQSAVDQGKAKPARAGQPVQLPDLPWPPQPTTARTIGDPQLRDALVTQAGVDGVGASKVLDVASNPRAVAAAIKASPKLAKAAREAIRERDRLDDATTQATIDQAARRASRAVEHALGVDPVASHLRAAAAELGQAILEVDLTGVQDEAQVRAALALVDRYRAMFRDGSSWSDDDRSFLADMGVQL